MKTIVEPKDLIDKLWGKQRIRDSEVYRLIRYVLRVDYNGKVLLHNVVTGQLVVLDDDEAEVIGKLPMHYDSRMEQLVQAHYLVPTDYDEHQQTINLRKIYFKLCDAQKGKDIIHYTILPTTACNARCYYCFEQGCETVTMTEQTAGELVDFIVHYCGDNKYVTLTWFGGEPTIATKRIDQICNGLNDAGVRYRSKMITNGYLFDEDMVKKAKNLWRLEGLQICIDGTEASYNRIKNYVAAKDNPYERVMRNVGILLKHGIAVGLRMNFDLGNYKEFSALADEVLHRFGTNPKLALSAHPVIGEYKESDGKVHHGSDDWFSDMNVELSNLSRELGLKNTKKELPSFNLDACGACSDASVTITPDGRIVKCPEQFGADQTIGDVRKGIVNKDLVESWKMVADYPVCIDCPLFPNCVKLVNCSNKGYCHKLKDYLAQCQLTIKGLYDNCVE